MNYVSYEDFKSMDMRLGLIRHVETIEGADKLLRFEIDFGEYKEAVIQCTGSCEVLKDDTCEACIPQQACTIHCECDPQVEREFPFGKEEYQGRDIRQIVSGIREYFPEYESLIGSYGLYILNLEPREIRGVMSYGMLMAVDGIDGKPVFVGPQGSVEPGAKIR